MSFSHDDELDALRRRFPGWDIHRVLGGLVAVPAGTPFIQGMDLGSIAEKLPPCHYCGRTRQRLAPCCDRPEHEHQLACADVAGCRDFLLGRLRGGQP
jgi:hypothetical protein